MNPTASSSLSPADDRGVVAAAAAASAPALSDRAAFGAAIFLSSFLLFQVQPIVARQILPWFGGSAAVWATSLLFFQSALFLGYGYAHLLRRLAPAAQRNVHAGVLLLSLAFLPVLASPAWKPVGEEDPLPRILGLLAATVGLPYFLLSANTPLMQLWLTQRNTALPWRFYAISNAASLAALLAYPLLVEPFLAARQQAMVWSAGYAGFVAMAVWLAKTRPAAVAARPQAKEAVASPTLGARLQWLVLSAIPCLLSLSVTNHLCQNVAAVPFLWIAPLAIYLLSLIVCFEGDGGWYRRRVFVPLHAAAIGFTAWRLLDNSPSLILPVVTFSAALGFWCVYLHGELARRKPAAQHLTGFYLMMSLGGALGAAATALGAPYFLKGNYELPVALALCALVTLMLEYRRHWATDIGWAAVAVAALASAMAVRNSLAADSLASVRNFYGGLRIVEAPDRRVMVHGTISHGVQLRPGGVPARRATAYYAPGSGIQQAIELTRRPGQRVGVVGLGIGTLAAYARPGDTYRFYEINPAVVRLAQQYFTFLSGADGAHVSTATGDGRLLLEREAPGEYDVLAIDAFSGDSIPVHLLSREAFEVYARHLRPGGILALHVSNTLLNLAPVAEALAASARKESRHVHATQDDAIARAESDWVLVADSFPTNAPGKPRGAAAARTAVWTDDHSHLLATLK
ncbi:MAG: fused MFS/spermidine synthase [Bryobacterales bacterium]|nr:fused MFS/spermidine synthase [Bryobacterales bacterium]